jgi:hypothetical protein
MRDDARMRTAVVLASVLTACGAATPRAERATRSEDQAPDPTTYDDLATRTADEPGEDAARPAPTSDGAERSSEPAAHAPPTDPDEVADPIPLGALELADPDELPHTGARIRTAASDVDGRYERADVGVTVHAHLAEIRACYETELATAPDLAGRIDVRFRIGRDGVPSHVVVADDDVGVPALAECIRTALATWTFPAPPGAPPTVTYPFVLDVVTR